MSAYRIFIVGCPRSGTTLLQSLLGSHPKLWTLPESYLWSSLSRGDMVQTSLLRQVGGIDPGAPLRLWVRLRKLGLLGYWLPPPSPWLKHWSQALAGCLDRAARAGQAEGWLEKTPVHLRHLDLLSAVQNVRILHMVRQGVAVATSLQRVASENPHHGEGDYSLESGLREWEVAQTLTQRWGRRPGHRVVHYEKLVADPQGELGELCRFLELPPCSSLMERAPFTFQRVSLYPVDSSALGPISNRNQTLPPAQEVTGQLLRSKERFWSRPADPPTGWFPRLELVRAQGSIAGKSRWPYVYTLKRVPPQVEPEEAAASWQLRRRLSWRLRLRESRRALRLLLQSVSQQPASGERLRLLSWVLGLSGRPLPTLQPQPPPGSSSAGRGLRAIGPDWMQPWLDRSGVLPAQRQGLLLAVGRQLPVGLSLEQALALCEQQPVALWLLEGASPAELEPLRARCQKVYSQSELAPALDPSEFHPLAPAPRPGALPSCWERLARAVVEPGHRLDLGELQVDAAHPWWGRAQQLVGWRFLLRHHTLKARMLQVAQELNLEPETTPLPLASILLPSCRPELLERALQNFLRQTYPRRELILVTHGFLPDSSQRERLHSLESQGVWWLSAGADWRLGTCLQYAFDQSRGSLIFRMDDDDHYGSHYIEDMADLLLSTGAGIVGKTSQVFWFEELQQGMLREPDREYQWCLLQSGATLGMRREVLEALGWSSLPRGEDTELLLRAWVAGIPQASADRFNFRCCRNQARTHTWQMSPAELIRQYPPLPPGASVDL